MSSHCRTKRSCRFLAASSILRSWFLGRLGMTGPDPKDPSLLSSGAASGAAAPRVAGPFCSRNSSIVWARLCSRCQRSAIWVAPGAPLASASR
jgi:hypothetical protein